jgi:hypothetical protein
LKEELAPSLKRIMARLLGREGGGKESFERKPFSSFF